MQATQNLEGYVRWRGDLSFAKSPFNLIDNLVLCKLAYYDFADLPEVADGKGLALRECHERLGDTACIKGLQEQGAFLRNCAESERFGDVLLRSYVDLDPSEHGTQFCAMEFAMDERHSYVAFRGTDSTLVGWREDFEIGYRPALAQKRALEYLRHLVGEGRSFMVGGHSKGANLALYATALLEEELLGRVRRVFLNDGPGLCKDAIHFSLSESFLRKAIRVLPAYSVFGRLFEQTEIPKVIVRTSVDGLMAHELMNWEVQGGRLVYADEHHEASDRVAQAFGEWMDNVSPDEREEFVSELFGALAAGGAHHITELGKRGLEGVEDIVGAFVSAKRGAKVTFARLPLGVALGSSLTKIRQTGLLRWVLGDDLAHNVELVLLGLTFLLARDEALLGMVSLLFLGIVVLLIVETALRMRGRPGGLKSERWRVNVCVVATVFFVTTLIKDDALFVYGSACLGILLTAMVVFYANQARSREQGKIARMLSAFAALLLAACAIFVFVAPAEAMDALAAVIGVLFIVAGALGAVALLRKRRVAL